MGQFIAAIVALILTVFAMLQSKKINELTDITDKLGEQIKEISEQTKELAKQTKSMQDTLEFQKQVRYNAVKPI